MSVNVTFGRYDILVGAFSSANTDAQTVVLRFDGIDWPHISVTTLVKF